jgi:sugar-specific transcriptional regulator TrmB
MDKSLLSALGLNEKEIDIYLFLINERVQSVKQIADSTRINRTTTYRYLESLREKGLVHWIIAERGLKVEVTQSEALQLLLDAKKKELEKISSQLPNYIRQLDLQKPVEKLDTQIRYYKGQKGIQQLFWDSLQAKETTRSYAPLRRRDFINPEFENQLEEEWANRGLKDKVITNENRMNYIKSNLLPIYKETLNVRIIPSKKFYITNDIIVYNNILAIASFEKNNLVGVEIENAEIAKTQKSIFDLVWNIAKPIKIQ